MNDQRTAEGLVTVRGAGDGFAQEIVSGETSSSKRRTGVRGRN